MEWWYGNMSTELLTTWPRQEFQCQIFIGSQPFLQTHRQTYRRFAQDGWQELDAFSRRSSEMARDWRGLCPAVDCSRLMMMMLIWYILSQSLSFEIWFRIEIVYDKQVATRYCNYYSNFIRWSPRIIVIELHEGKFF
jgi:hypothetical protein